MRKLMILAALPLLAACDPAQFAASILDPDATACRQQGARIMSVPFDQTSAQRVNSRLSSSSNFDVRAGGLTFRCTVNSSGEITRFARI